MGFERARQPEHKEQRRAAILSAAETLFDAHGLRDVSLSAIAREAKSSKANLYRYFESREAIYLTILAREYESFIALLEQKLAPQSGSNDADEVARVLARELAGRPRLVHLSSLVGSVLEQNVSVEGVRNFKREVAHSLLRFLNCLHAAMPALDIPTCERALTFIVAFGGGIYHSTSPGPTVQELLKEPEFEWMKRDFESTVYDHTRVVLRGLLATG